MKRRASWLAALALVGAAACRDTADVAPICAIDVSTPTVLMALGDGIAVGATVSCSGVARPVVTWTSLSPDIATVDSIGVVRGVAVGQTRVRGIVAGVPGAMIEVTVAVVLRPTASWGPMLQPQAATLRAGTTLRFTVTLSCGPSCGVDTTRRVWSSADTTIATIDQTGLVTARRPGQTVVRFALRDAPTYTAGAVVTVTNALSPPPSVSPATIVLAPGTTQQITASLPPFRNAPAGTDTTVSFRAADSCIAAVSPTGLVTGRVTGKTTIDAYARRDTNARTTIPVTVVAPPGRSMTFQSITSGAPPADADLGAVGGTIAVTVRLAAELVTFGGRLELALGGRVAATQTFAAALPTAPLLSATLVVPTDARDANGARLYVNGATSLAATFSRDAATGASACGASAISYGPITQTLTLVNP